MLIVSLVQANTDWQVQAHAPVFHLARETAVHCVDDEDRECEDVHREQGEEHEWNIAHSEDGVLAVHPGEETCRVEEERISDGEDDVGNAIAVEIFVSEVESTGVEVDHCGDVTWIVEVEKEDRLLVLPIIPVCVHSSIIVVYLDNQYEKGIVTVYMHVLKGQVKSLNTTRLGSQGSN